MGIKAIFFDVDGTLYNERCLFIPGVFLLLKHWKLFSSYRKVRHFLHKKIEPVPGDKQNFLIFQADLQSLLLGQRYSRDKILDWRAKFIADFDQMFAKISPVDYIVPCLQECSRLGLKMGILSDLPLSNKIERLGLSGYWQAQISSEDLGVLKPNALVFQRAAEIIGVNPESIIFVGNHYHYDILGAHATGMKTAHYTKKKINNSKADFTFLDYRQLTEKLKQWV